MISAQSFKKRFISLIILTWTAPPVVGLSFLLFIRMFTVEQMFGLLISPLESLFIFGSLGFAVWYFNRHITPVVQLLDTANTALLQTAEQQLRRFTFHFWLLFLVYLIVAPSTVIISAEWYTDFTARPIDWFRIHLVALIVSIIIGLPIFFLILDLFGKIIGQIGIEKPHITIKAKVFLIGALVPLLIDTMLVQYYWTRTGFFSFETFMVWLALELLAIGGSIIFARSFAQSLRPLQTWVDQKSGISTNNIDQLTPQSTDELGVLAINYKHLLSSWRKNVDQLIYQGQVIAHIKDSLVTTDLEGNITGWNKGAERLFGYSGQFMTGRHISFVYPDEELNTLQELIHILQSQGTHETEVNMKRMDGETFCANLSLSMLHDENGQPVGMIGYSVDITDKKLAESAQLEKEMAEAASQAKTRFLANMSHEIRTPLNGVLGMARIGERETSPEKMKEIFRLINNSGQHLLHIVNDILDLSKLEAGKLVIDNHTFNLTHLINDATTLVSKTARDKGLEIHIHVSDKVPTWIVGDDIRLKQILVNLLSNAVKFTAQGEIRLDIICDEDSIRFTVSDTGIGMNGEQLNRLFAPFDQADTSTSRRYGGTGLGMAISKTLAELMHGDIEAKSSLGEGSTISLVLPLIKADQQTDHKSGTLESGSYGNRLNGVRVLAAEDVDINRIILEDLLASEGAEATFAENGMQAIEYLEKSGVEAFDIVLMDIQMPIMDGYEATRQIKKIAPALPVIGLTAHALNEEKQMSLNAGMIDHITKPIDADELVASISRHMNPL